MVRLTGEEFLRRWVQHVLPRGFVKIRHYGLLANRDREERLQLCRTLLALWSVLQVVVGVLGSADESGGGGRRSCPRCGGELWRRVGEVPRAGEMLAAEPASGPGGPDTS